MPRDGDQQQDLRGLQHSSSSTADRGQKSGGGRGLVGILTATCVALLAVVGYLGVKEHTHSSQIAAIQAALQAGLHQHPESRQLAFTQAPPAPTTVSDYPNVLLSQQPASPQGYQYSGSLFQGTGYWTQQTPIIAARSDLGAVTVGAQIYLIGGSDAEGNHLDLVTAYDAVLDESLNLTSMPEPRAHFACATDNATIYVVGGYSADADEDNSTPGGCILAYNVSADTWATGPCMRTPRADACASVLNGVLYVAGGSTTGGQPVASIEAYNPATKAWSVLATNLVAPATQVACASLNSSVLVVAGGTYANSSDSALVQAVTVGTFPSVQQLSLLPSARFDAQLVALPSGDLLACGGGQHVNGTQVGLHDVNQYVATGNVWIAKAPLDNQRFSFGAAYLDEGVYVIGGNHYCDANSDESCHTTASLDSVEVFYDSGHPDVYVHILNPSAQAAPSGINTSQVLLLGGNTNISGYAAQGSLYTGAGYWSPGPDLPYQLSDMSVVAAGRNLYVIGGIEQTDTVCVNTLYQYDPVQQQYTQLANMPQANCRGGAAVLNNKIYVVAGFDSADETALPLDTTMMYDIASNTWSMLTATLATARSDCCSAAVDGLLYTAGGYSTNYTTTLSSVEVYDPNSNTWSAAPDMLTPRGDLMCAIINDNFVAVGGFYDPTNEFAVTAQRTEVQAYDPATGQWSSLAPLPQSRDDMALAGLPGDRMLVMGGETHANDTRDQIATHQVYEYIGASDAWVPKAPMTTSRFRFNAAWNEEAVWVFGGASSSLCTAPGNGLEECTERPLASSEAFYDSSPDDIFIYFQTEDSE